VDRLVANKLLFDVRNSVLAKCEDWDIKLDL
jgi:hypothetical protein